MFAAMRGRLWGAAVIVPMMAALSLGGTAATGQSPAVLLVGPPGYPGAQYSSIQAAVNGANAGDWILVAPGIYHEKGLPGTKDPAGVWIGPTKNGIHLRGMDRNQVIVDGTNLAGSADGSGTLPATAANLAAAFASAPGAQDFGPKDSSGSALGRNGIEVYKASGTWVENLSACNFLVGSGHTGNEIWWNAGDGSGQTPPMSVWGNYITATST